MTDTLKSFWAKNMQWVITLIFLVGFYFAVMLDKVDKEEVRAIVKEEIRESVYTKTEGKVLETRFDALEKKIDTQDKKLDNILDILNSKK